jgi:hypothetical protein
VVFVSWPQKRLRSDAVTTKLKQVDVSAIRLTYFTKHVTCFDFFVKQSRMIERSEGPHGCRYDEAGVAGIIALAGPQ